MVWFIVGAAVIVLTLLISLFTYRICFHSSRKRLEDAYRIPDGEQYRKVADRMKANTRKMDDAYCEYVAIRSWDGTELHGRFYPIREGAPLKIVFHGYRSMAIRDSAGGYTLATRLGMNVLAVDQRAHGKSGGQVISFGVNERRDCLSWVEYANKRFGNNTPIIISGLSMGAATVLMATELDLPKNVACVMADCPYSSPSAIIRKVSRDRGYPVNLAYPFIWLGALIYGGFCLTESAAVTAVQKAKIPILLIHGEDDRFVPCYMSREIYDNCASRAELHTFPGAGHGLCYILDPLRYEQICINFLMSIPALQNFMLHSEYVQKTLGRIS